MLENLRRPKSACWFGLTVKLGWFKENRLWGRCPRESEYKRLFVRESTLGYVFAICPPVKLYYDYFRTQVSFYLYIVLYYIQGHPPTTVYYVMCSCLRVSSTLFMCSSSPVTWLSDANRKVPLMTKLRRGPSRSESCWLFFKISELNGRGLWLKLLLLVLLLILLWLIKWIINHR